MSFKHVSQTMVEIMKSRFILLLTAVFLSLSAQSFSQTGPADSLTVNEAVRMVLSTNPAVQQAAEQVSASQAGVKVSKSPLYPEGGVSLNYARIGPIPAFSFPGFGNIVLAPANNYDEHIGFSGTVYDFNRRQKSVDLAETQVQSSKDRLELVRQDLAYRTIQTFYAVLFLQRSIRVQDDAINTLNEHISMTKKKVEAGTATDFDVLTTQVRVAAAQDEKINLENSLSNTEIVLRRLLGYSQDSPLNLAGEFNETPLSLNTDSLTGIAMENRVELKSANDEIATAQARYNMASAADNPSLNVAFAWGFKNGYEPNLNAWRGNFAAAAQLQIPISGVVPFFGGYSKQSMEEEAGASMKAAESYKSNAVQEVKADVQRGIVDLRSSLEKLRTSDITVQQADSALSIARIRYEAGTVTNLDLLDAETALAQARLMRLQALYKYVIGRYEVQQAIGDKTW